MTITHININVNMVAKFQLSISTKKQITRHLKTARQYATKQCVQVSKFKESCGHGCIKKILNILC